MTSEPDSTPRRRPPTIDLTRAQATYLQLIDQYPKFRKIDTVLYLYAFSLRDQGKIRESVRYFQTILDKYPRSRYVADAWMAIAEFRFYEQQDYKSSLEAYEQVLKASHTFNLLDARGAISVTERVGVMARIRTLVVGVAKAYAEQGLTVQAEALRAETKTAG